MRGGGGGGSNQRAVSNPRGPSSIKASTTAYQEQDQLRKQIRTSVVEGYTDLLK